MNLYWSSWSEFVAMSGYGLYVWGSFGVVALVIALEIWAIAARRRALVRAREHDPEGHFGDTFHETQN
jgi:heme exporter protein D